MLRKIFTLTLLVLLAALALASPALAAKSYRAERFDVQIDLQAGGSAVITETVEFRFEGDPFTYAFREISATETDGLTFLEASMDGVPLSPGTGPSQVEVEPGNPLKVTWHFAPTANASHVFTVRYRAEGVIRKGDADTFRWRAIPEDHDYPIAHSTITLTYPPEAAVLGQPSLDWDFDAAWQEERLILTASDIPEDQELILTARFAPDSLAQTAPRWQARNEQTAAATEQALPVGLAAGAITVLLGGLGLLTYIRANGRDLNLNTVIPVTHPPADVSPAIVGKLTRQQNGLMGTIFDLAQRGILEVREESGFWRTKNHMLVRKSTAERLQPHEQGLLEGLFEPGQEEIKMSEIGTRLASRQGDLDEPLEQALVQRGWLDPERKQKRSRLIMFGILGMLTAVAVFVGSLIAAGMNMSASSPWLVLSAAAAGIGAGLFLLSFPLLIWAAGYSVLTPAGEEQAARWKGFAEYLRQVSRGREPAIRPDYFERYLAYAAVFGLGARWAKYFQSLGGVPLPVWFHAAAGSNGDFGAMVAIMSASDSAGASAAAGGGAGASGGGSSGAG
jgi:uncharacterized protein (TIGR04222 family)